MLALRNGSTLQPFYIPGVMHSAQPSSTGIYFNGGEGMPGSSRGVGSLTADQELPVQTVYNASSDQKIFMSSAMEHGNLEYSFALEPSSSNHCRPFNLGMPSKEIYGGSKLPQLHLDAGCCGDESSSVLKMDDISVCLTYNPNFLETCDIRMGWAEVAKPMEAHIDVADEIGMKLEQDFDVRKQKKIRFIFNFFCLDVYRLD
ncbi:hypothetical protein V2J09_011775 [Rumex salicifolius]